ncbi:hypothetical protein OROMI_017084 [Orobanche minor]
MECVLGSFNPMNNQGRSCFITTPCVARVDLTYFEVLKGKRTAFYCCCVQESAPLIYFSSSSDQLFNSIRG